MLAPPNRCHTFLNGSVLTRQNLVAEYTTGEKSGRKGDPAGSSSGPAYSREKPDGIMGGSLPHQSVPQTAELDKANAPSGLTGKRSIAKMTSFSDESEDVTLNCPWPDPTRPGTHDNSSTGTPSNPPEQQAEGPALLIQVNSRPTCGTSPEEEERRREHSRDMDNFVINAAREYDDMLKNLQIMCRTEAEKHNLDAASCRRICHNLETMGRVFGTVSLAGVVRFMFADADTNLTSIGLLAFSGVAITGVLQFLSKGSARPLPSFKKRANEHRVATFGWLLLKHEIQATRIGLRNPEVDLKEVETMYKEHVAKRKELSEQILVSEQTSDQTNSHPALLKTKVDEEKSFLAPWPVDRLRRDRVNDTVTTRTTGGLVS